MNWRVEWMSENKLNVADFESLHEARQFAKIKSYYTDTSFCICEVSYSAKEIWAASKQVFQEGEQ